MSDGITVKLDERAFAALDRVLDELGGKAAIRVLDWAGRGVMKPMLSFARARVPERYGVLRKSLGLKTKKYRHSGTVFTVMGPRSGFKTPVVNTRTGRTFFVDPVNYAHLVERGTRAHSITSGSLLPRETSEWHRASRGKPRGPVVHPGARAQPFMRPAWDTLKASAMKVYAQRILRGFDREAKKLVAKYGAGRKLP